MHLKHAGEHGAGQHGISRTTPVFHDQRLILA
jgi:hypothetical protein